MFPSPDFDDILARAQNGQEPAFATLVDRTTPRLVLMIRRAATSVVGPDFEVEDIFQLTLARAWRLLPSCDFRGEARFYAWLVSLARGVIGNRAEYLEAKGRGKIRRIESLVDGGSDRMPFIDGISVSSLAARREDIVGLESALAALDPLQRKIVEQTVLMGATLSEVAAETGLPRSTVFDRLGSAMAELRRFTSNPRSSPKDP